SRTKAGNLAAQFRADRAACTGHHHHPTAQPLAQAIAVQHDGVATEEVVELDVTDGGELRTAVHQIVVRRHGERLDTGCRTQFGDAPAYCMSRGWQSEDHRVNAKA